MRGKLIGAFLFGLSVLAVAAPGMPVRNDESLQRRGLFKDYPKGHWVYDALQRIDDALVDGDLLPEGLPHCCRCDSLTRFEVVIYVGSILKKVEELACKAELYRIDSETAKDIWRLYREVEVDCDLVASRHWPGENFDLHSSAQLVLPAILPVDLPLTHWMADSVADLIARNAVDREFFEGANARMAVKKSNFADVPFGHWDYTALSRVDREILRMPSERSPFQCGMAMTRYEFAVATLRACERLESISAAGKLDEVSPEACYDLWLLYCEFSPQMSRVGKPGEAPSINRRFHSLLLPRIVASSPDCLK